MRFLSISLVKCRQVANPIAAQFRASAKVTRGGRNCVSRQSSGGAPSVSLTALSIQWFTVPLSRREEPWRVHAGRRRWTSVALTFTSGGARGVPAMSALRAGTRPRLNWVEELKYAARDDELDFGQRPSTCVLAASASTVIPHAGPDNPWQDGHPCCMPGIALGGRCAFEHSVPRTGAPRHPRAGFGNVP